MKISIVGVGRVGSSCAEFLAQQNFLSELVLVDRTPNEARGKAMDMMQSAGIHEFQTQIVGTDTDYGLTQNSDVVVITSGSPRKPGMTREDLININAQIIQSVTCQILQHSPNAILIMVANPMDVMTYLTIKIHGLPRNQVVGMGNLLDSARLKYQLALALNASIGDIDAMVIGAHSDTGMMPLSDMATYKGLPVTQWLSNEALNTIVENTKKGGTAITNLLGTSAWYAPGIAAGVTAQAIACDQKRLMPCSVLLQSEYGLTDVCLGVPVVLGKQGVESIVSLNLNPTQKTEWNRVAQIQKDTQALLPI